MDSADRDERRWDPEPARATVTMTTRHARRRIVRRWFAMRFIVPIALAVFATVLAVAVTALVTRASVLHAPAVPTEEPA
jgi:hypothetical protein